MGLSPSPWTFCPRALGTIKIFAACVRAGHSGPVGPGSMRGPRVLSKAGSLVGQSSTLESRPSRPKLAHCFEEGSFRGARPWFCRCATCPHVAVRPESIRESGSQSESDSNEPRTMPEALSAFRPIAIHRPTSQAVVALWPIVLVQFRDCWYRSRGWDWATTNFTKDTSDEVFSASFDCLWHWRRRGSCSS